ncbi:CGNR zinc finger domain-containing protein [Actinomadura sp. HBU206391]|uniref:CGNR zinc finger domain-containing protein n=1 Tax=Actinomadura sp. HBU206391 TaxID=2731692 RepID=UPI00165001D9|nr:CGNR zinc finger domain-containing protein [Actinomadura sp. HBU206391]MBC6460914.1 CGNR zinc finger domain-containing protein [Actinomadura sp. HBU206391]
MTDPSAAAALIRDFANTIDVEERTDVFADADGAADWLRGHGLLDDTTLPGAADGNEPAFGEDDRLMAVTLRAGFRERLLITGGGDGDVQKITQAQRLLDELPLSVALGAEAEPLRPVTGTAARIALARVAAAWAHVCATGEWRRLKRCPDHTCGWVFWDATRSRTRRWCTMRVCGNRAKTRAYSERRRAG